MKKIAFIFSLLVCTAIGMAQKNDNILSFEGIGSLRLGMSKAELEKLLNMKIVLKHIGIDEVYVETISVKFQGADLELYLMRNEEKTAVLESITTKNPVYKTKEGIGVGTDELTIINKYEDHMLIIQPGYDDGPDFKRARGITTITLAHLDDIRSAIIFTLENKKVVKIEIGPTPEFRDRE